MRAARQLGGFKNVKELARNINERGLGTTKLRQIEREEITPEIRDLHAIAQACGLPFEWFVADFRRLAEIAPGDPRKVLAEELAAAGRRADERRAGRRGETLPPEEEAL